MHRTVLVANSSFIERSHKTKNTDNFLSVNNFNRWIDGQIDEGMKGWKYIGTDRQADGCMDG
jgi:hypothetical protein